MKKTWKRVMLLAICAAFLLTGATACSSKPTLKVYNWGYYIADDVLDDFEEEYGIRVVYETFDSNEAMHAKVSAGAGSSYDVLVPSDYMIAQMISEDMLAKLDYSNIPNMQYIDDNFRNLAYDPSEEYSVPYLYGTVGILYNTKMVDDPVDSLEIMWNEKYSGQIFMMDSIRDTIGLTLKMLGYSANTTDENELEAAKQKLIEQRPLVLAYVTDDAKDKMVAGEGAMALVYGGIAYEAIAENPDLAYVVPKEGTNVAVDSLVVTKNSKMKTEAEQFINYLTSPDVAIKNAQIGYCSPNKAAIDALWDDPDFERGMYPTQEEIDNSEDFLYIPGREAILAQLWTEIKGEG